jgi:hypothetical protein
MFQHTQMLKPTEEQEMADHSRRAFIRGAGVTAAAATVAVMVPGVASAASKSDDDGAPTPDGQVVAHVTNAKAGTITVMRGDREVEVTDKALASKLAKLATG